MNMKPLIDFVSKSFGMLYLGMFLGVAYAAFSYGFLQLNETSTKIGLSIVTSHIIYLWVQRTKHGAWRGLRGLGITVVGFFFLCSSLWVGHALGDTSNTLDSADLATKLHGSAIYLMVNVAPWFVTALGLMWSVLDLQPELKKPKEKDCDHRSKAIP
jgi:hypothetical protein